MNNPFSGKSLSDPIEKDTYNKDVYSLDCYNIDICKCYGEISFACVAGAFANTRCSLGEKMQIRILHDSNPRTVYKNLESESDE